MLTAHIRTFLDISGPPCNTDCIFVLAGKQERKVYGIQLWNQGFAPELILSVGRFEWRRFYALELPSDGGLMDLVRRTPPVERHFFIRLSREAASAEPVKRGRYGTWTEADALAASMRRSPPRSLMVVSSPIHLRRVRLVFRRAFRPLGTSLSFVAAPEDPGSVTAADVWTEFGKFILYSAHIMFWPR